MILERDGVLDSITVGEGLAAEICTLYLISNSIGALGDHRVFLTDGKGLGVAGAAVLPFDGGGGSTARDGRNTVVLEAGVVGVCQNIFQH